MLLPIYDKTGEGSNASSRYGAKVRLFVGHTEEGNSNADGLTEWMKRNNVSYHYVSDPDHVNAIVDTDLASWSVGDANGFCINWCFAGSKSKYTRAEWLARENEIETLAYTIVQDAAKYDPLTADLFWHDYDAISDGACGVTDHSGITYGLGIGNHTDCGGNFPEDVLRKWIDHYRNPTPVAPPRNEIDYCASQCDWLGERLTAGEQTCPDGVGRFAQFANGYVYWHPATGAWSIPTNIFETWASLGYEEGALGYPIGYHTVLPDAEDPIGDVQGFQRGAIYRRYGQPGYHVHGAIRDAWNRSGFETGPFGWPISFELHSKDVVYQNFDNGYITYSPTGTVGMRPVDGPDYEAIIGH